MVWGDRGMDTGCCPPTLRAAPFPPYDGVSKCGLRFPLHATQRFLCSSRRNIRNSGVEEESFFYGPTFKISLFVAAPYQQCAYALCLNTCGLYAAAAGPYPGPPPPGPDLGSGGGKSLGGGPDDPPWSLSDFFSFGRGRWTWKVKVVHTAMSVEGLGDLL